MTSRPMAWVQAHATPGRISIVAILFLGFSAWFFGPGPYGVMADHGGIPDERFFTSHQDHTDSVGGMGKDGRSDYEAFLWWDLGFTVLLGATTLGLIARWTKVFRPGWGDLGWLPVAAAGSDVLENLSMLLWLQADSTLWIFVIAQHLKLFTVVPSLLLALAGLLHLLVHGIMHPVKR